MNPRERYLETLLFGTPDRIPLLPGGPRESTLATWHTQGLGEGMPYQDALAALLHLPPEAFAGPLSVPVDLRMIPTFPEEVLEHRDGHYLVRDWMGAITEISDRYDYTYIRSAKDFVTRKWHRFPVQTRADWELMRARYDPADPARFPGAESCAALADSGRALTISLNGPFWQLREWLGMENLCLLLRDDPSWAVEMIATWQAFTLGVLDRAMRLVRVDALCVSEDMAYKAHSMISPTMARRFLQPTYRQWHALCQAHQVPLLDMDSDGFIEDLVPVWIEGGYNCCNPLEVAAGNDLVAMRRRFGRSMAYHGGIDKRSLAAGGDAMRQELARVVPPLLAEGGYIPGCDHGVPPDIAWPDFVAYAGALADLCGWR